jgi:phosphonate transport system ATP-binding protein
LIKVENLTVRYKGSSTNALNDINISFKQGEFVCVLGKSGAGKSTLIRTFNGLQQPTEGTVYYQDTNLTVLNEKLLREIRSEMGMIFQHFNLIPRLSVLQNVLTGTFGKRNSLKSLFGIFAENEMNEANKLIEDVELLEHATKRVEHLSGGQKQRVAIARALQQNPTIFLGDEPVASLDPGTSKRIFELLLKLHKQHQLLTIINVHDIGLAISYATRIIGLNNGKIVFDGLPSEFTEDIQEEIYS